jgi:hypothetical protein
VSAEAADGEGRIATERLGNGLSITRHWDPHSGRLVQVQSAVPSYAEDLSYAYAPNGNVRSRTDGWLGKTESFAYDGANGWVSNFVTFPRFLGAHAGMMASLRQINEDFWMTQMCFEDTLCRPFDPSPRADPMDVFTPKDRSTCGGRVTARRPRFPQGSSALRCRGAARRRLSSAPLSGARAGARGCVRARAAAARFAALAG